MSKNIVQFYLNHFIENEEVKREFYFILKYLSKLKVRNEHYLDEEIFFQLKKVRDYYIKFFDKELTWREKLKIYEKILFCEALIYDPIKSFADFFIKIFSEDDLNLQIFIMQESFYYDVITKLDKETLIYFLNNLIKNEKILDFKFVNFRNFIAWLWQIKFKMKISNNEIKEVFVPPLIWLIKNLIKMDRISDVIYVELFAYTIAIFGVMDLEKDFEEIEEKICRPCQNYYREWVKRQNLPQCKREVSKKGKIKIAIVRPNLRYWSPFKVEYSLLKALLQDKEFKEKYEIYFYSMTVMEIGDRKEEVYCREKLKELGIEVISPVRNYVQKFYLVDFAQMVLDFRSRIIEDEIDVVIWSDHFYGVGELLFISRCAPKQVYWSHMNVVVDFPEIDFKFLQFDLRGKYLRKDPKKHIILNIPLAENFLVGSEEDKREGFRIKDLFLKKYGKDTIILGTIGRLEKIDSEEYLKVVKEIMGKFPNSIYIAAGKGNTASIKRKIKKIGIDLGRFLFTGFVNPHVYGWVIDIWLDSFPHGQGMSKEEFLAKDKPLVLHIKREDIDPNDKGIGVYIARDNKEYIAIVEKLIKDKDFRKEIVKLEKKAWFSYNINVRRIFEKILE